jgi:hypothetical protein
MAQEATGLTLVPEEKEQEMAQDDTKKNGLDLAAFTLQTQEIPNRSVGRKSSYDGVVQMFLDSGEESQVLNPPAGVELTESQRNTIIGGLRHNLKRRKISDKYDAMLRGPEIYLAVRKDKTPAK